MGVKTLRGVFIILLGVIVIVISGFFVFIRLNKKPQEPNQKIVIANIGEYSIFNIIAQEKGYFTQHGLNAHINEYESGPAAVADLLAGQADVAIAADFVGVRNIFADQNLRILTQVSKHRVFQVISRKDKGIQTPADLKGKTIGVTKKGAGEFLLGRYLTLNNISLNDVNILDLTPADMTTQIENDQIDAIVIFDPHAYNIKTKLGDRVNLWSAQGEQETFALGYTTKNFTETHPDILKKYLAAILDAEQYTKINPGEAQKIIAQKLNYADDYVEYLWQNFNFSHHLDQELILTMENQARWLITNNLVPNAPVPNYLNFIYFDGLETIDPQRINIPH